MEKEHILKIFEEAKMGYLQEVSPSESPRAYILGGQPSSGKSSISRLHIDTSNTLLVNGDEYRIHHPDVEELSKNISEYSRETQEFSNVFTEGFIKEAIKNKYNIVVEGTMRRPEVVLDTAKMFRDAGFQVEAHAIAAPKEFTAVNIFHRYHKAVSHGEMGRLSDIESHNQAVEGLTKTLDSLYGQKAVDKIKVYSMFGMREVGEYTLSSSHEWIGSKTKPSTLVLTSREAQINSLELNHLFLSRGTEALISISSQPQLIESLSLSLSTLSANVRSIAHRSEQTELRGKIQRLEDDIQRITYSSRVLKDEHMPELWSTITRYNENRANELGRHITEISISQAIGMVLDNRTYRQNDELLSATKGELMVNGVPYIQELGKEDNLSPKRSR